MGNMGQRQVHWAWPLRKLSCPVDRQLLLLERLPQVCGMYVLVVEESRVLVADECYNSCACENDRSESTVEQVLSRSQWKYSICGIYSVYGV